MLVFLLNSLLEVVKKYFSFEDQKIQKRRLLDLVNTTLYLKFNIMKSTLINFTIELFFYNENENLNDLLSNLNVNLSIEKKPISLLRGNSEIIEDRQVFDNLDLRGVNESTKLNLLQTIYESNSYDLNQKREFREKILGVEREMVDSYFRHTLQASLPDKKNKEKIWNMIVYKEGNYNDRVYQALMKGFSRVSQFSLVKKYLTERFFEDFQYVRKHQSERYTAMFFTYLKPDFLNTQQILEKFTSLHNSLDKNEFLLIDVVEKRKSHLLRSIRDVLESEDREEMVQAGRAGRGPRRGKLEIYFLTLIKILLLFISFVFFIITYK